MKCDLGITVLVQHDKSAVTIHHRLCLDLWTTLQHLFQRVVYHIGHRQKTAATACLGFLNVVFTTTLTNQLVIHTDSAILEVQILSGQTAKLADSHAGFQKHYKLIIVFVVSIVSLDEIHPDRQLFFGKCNSRHRIVHHNICQLEDEWILPDRILIASHLECGLHHTSYTGNGTVTSAVLLQLCKPLFCIGYLDGADFAIAKILFLDQIQNKIITDLRVVAHAFLQADVLLQQFNYRNLSCFIINAIINLFLNFLFLLAKFLQRGCVNRLSLATKIRIPVLIDPILSLTFSCFQDTAFVIFSFFAQFRSPFIQKESRCDINIVSHRAISFYDESTDIRSRIPARGIYQISVS